MFPNAFASSASRAEALHHHHYRMKYFEPTEVSSSWRPILRSNESLIVQQGSVGLYER